MARIDVSELLVDPDFVDCVTVLRQSQSVDQYGIASHTQVPIQIIASVQAAGSDALNLLPDLERADGAIEVITQTPLLTATDATAADIVLWRGRQWVVKNVDYFKNFGSAGGHVEAVATLKNLLHMVPGP